MAFSDEQITELRSTLGLADDADEAAIVAAAAEVVDKATEPAPATQGTKVPEGMTLIENDVLDNLREQGTQGAAARAQQLEEKRDNAIKTAISDGKITPARQEHWTKSWDADPEGTEQLLASLPTGIVPVAERGHDQNSTNASTAYDELYGKKGA